MAQYKTCLACGANLDPGERCDCDILEFAAEGATNVTVETAAYVYDQLSVASALDGDRKQIVMFVDRSNLRSSCEERQKRKALREQD